jgi:hypothetical protein
MKLRLLTTIFAISAILGAVNVPSGASSAPNPYAQMKAVLTDANVEQTFRYTLTLSMSGKRLVTVADATHLGGRQTITLTDAGQSNTVVVELIAGNVYLRGDATILATYMGYPKATAKQLANKWVEIPKSNPEFAGVSSGITIASTLAEVTMTQSVTSHSAVTLDGEMVDVLKGMSVKSAQNPSAKETLYFSAANKPLPIEVTENYQGSLATMVFSHWNETVLLVTPKTVLEQK